MLKKPATLLSNLLHTRGWAFVRPYELNAPLLDLQSGSSRKKKQWTQWIFLGTMVVSKNGSGSTTHTIQCSELMVSIREAMTNPPGRAHGMFSTLFLSWLCSPMASFPTLSVILRATLSFTILFSYLNQPEFLLLATENYCRYFVSMTRSRGGTHVPECHALCILWLIKSCIQLPYSKN